MEDEIVLAGKKYVSSKRAAEISGYAKDYVGQLCRGGKLSAKLIGRNWYILLDSLEKVSKKEDTEPKVAHTGAPTTIHTHPRTTLLDDLNPSFYSDDTPLMPPVEKSVETARVSINEHNKEPKVTQLEPQTIQMKQPKEVSVHTDKQRHEEAPEEYIAAHAPFRFASSALVLLLILSFTIAGLVYPFTGSVVSYGKEAGISSGFFLDTQLANSIYSQGRK
jgi:hypothetical protein